MDNKLKEEEKKLVDNETIVIRKRTPEERKAFIKGRISGLRTALDLIKGNFFERIGILLEMEKLKDGND